MFFTLGFSTFVVVTTVLAVVSAIAHDIKSSLAFTVLASIVLVPLLSHLGYIIWT